MSKLEYNNNTVKWLLDTAKSKYSNEHNRVSVIDSKQVLFYLLYIYILFNHSTNK